MRRLARLRKHDAAIVQARLRRAMRREAAPPDAISGECAFDGGTWAMFVIYQPDTLPWYVRTALGSLRRLGINVLAIVNSEPSSALVEELRRSTRAILVRDNSGFDFGAYRDGTIWLEAYSPGRVIYVNDSLYYFEQGLDPLFRTLASSAADVCAAFDNVEVSYHIQSFCFSVSGDFLRAPAFRDFWRRYLPASSRKWAVEQGELAFSRKVLPTARSVAVVFSTDRLVQRLDELSLEDIRGAAALLAPNVRQPAPAAVALGRDELIGEIARRVSFRSQIHNGGLLYTAVCGNPLMKRDLTYRGVFPAGEIRMLLGKIGRTDHLDEIMADLTRRKLRPQMSLWQRAIYDQGLG